MVLRVRLDTLLSKHVCVCVCNVCTRAFYFRTRSARSTWFLRCLLRRWQFYGLPILTNIRLHYFVCHRERFRSDDPRVSRFPYGPRSTWSVAKAADESAQNWNDTGGHRRLYLLLLPFLFFYLSLSHQIYSQVRRI